MDIIYYFEIFQARQVELEGMQFLRFFVEKECTDSGGR